MAPYPYHEEIRCRPVSMCGAHCATFHGVRASGLDVGCRRDMAEGSSITWDFRDGLVVTKSLEKEFEDGDFVIVPIPTAADQP